MATSEKCTKSAETRLAELIARVPPSSMQQWTIGERYMLAEAIVAAGDTFMVRRLLQRLERGEFESFENCTEAFPAVGLPSGDARVPPALLDRKKIPRWARRKRSR